MIIEFTGVPGSGKSTIFKELQNSSNLKVSFVENKSNIFYDVYLFIYFMFNIFDTYRYIFVLKKIFTTKNSLFHKLNICRNIIKKISKFYIYKNKEGVYIIDEGISHIPFNLFVDSSNSKIISKEVIELLDKLPMTDYIIIIDVDYELSLKRLKQRGHKRIDFTNVYKMENFLEKTFFVKDILQSYYKNKSIINNNNALESSIKNIKNIIKDFNV